MRPILFEIGPLAVYSYGVVLALAFMACWLVARWYVPRRGLKRDLALDLVLAAAIGGIVGARALYVATYWESYRDNPLWIFMLQRGGMVFYGGLVGGAIGVAVYTRVRRLPVGTVADTAALTVPLGSAIGRLGCFLNGCCLGRPTTEWFGVTFPSTPGPVIPSQVLDSGLNLAIFGALLLVASRRVPPSGSLWFAFLTMYPVTRFLVEMTRVNPSVAFGLTQAQLISVPVFAAGVAGLVFVLRRARAGEDVGGSRPAQGASPGPGQA
jgi:phosphatidylglycerol:prolipoprotein diacylglycerol transferase